MEEISVPVQVVRPGASLPCYMTAFAAGMDLFAALDAPLVLAPGERSLIPTGIALAIPPGYEGQIRPRSGLALRHGLSMVNAPGTIDADYRGEIGIILINHGSEPVTIEPDSRIAQLIFSRVQRAVLRQVDTLDATERGEGGFGHTGSGRS